MNKSERTQKVRVTDIKVGDSYFLYVVEQPIIKVIVKDNQITFYSKNNTVRTFNNRLTTRAIIRNEK